MLIEGTFTCKIKTQEDMDEYLHMLSTIMKPITESSVTETFNIEYMHNTD